ncbi:MAG: methylated-DNA--[protein]-cysteine S-methyltransferase [Bacteroidota bacterium]|nr:methylated-DNA--[protein]-cysteine S-methyltransferase [Bacteroidota bacterium]
MDDAQQYNYDRIAKAITYIRQHFRQQPGLDEIARHVGLSPFHFQKMFSDWAGTSPKKFLQYVSLQFAKEKLAQNESLFDTAYQTGLSGTSRLHDLFVKIEGMSPAEYKNGGEKLAINYQFSETRFGRLLIASTKKGGCLLSFYEGTPEAALKLLNMEFPKASFRLAPDEIQQNALKIFSQDSEDISEIKIHLKGTAFQLKVWEALLKIPQASLVSYNLVANMIEKPSSSRAVGNAIGKNPVAYIIPCHRVIKSTGELGGYRWNQTRKTAIIGWEATQKTEL